MVVERPELGEVILDAAPEIRKLAAESVRNKQYIDECRLRLFGDKRKRQADEDLEDPREIKRKKP